MTERYYEKCHDCGCEITKETRNNPKNTRHDICDGCWDNRGWLLTHREQIGLPKFQEIQRAMVNSRGTAKRKIEALKKVIV